MVIDTHIRPALFSPICENKERFEKRCDQMNYHFDEAVKYRTFEKAICIGRN